MQRKRRNALNLLGRSDLYLSYNIMFTLRRCLGKSWLAPVDGIKHIAVQRALALEFYSYLLG